LTKDWGAKERKTKSGEEQMLISHSRESSRGVFSGLIWNIFYGGGFVVFTGEFCEKLVFGGGFLLV
jgi:hypothetical protein